MCGEFVVGLIYGIGEFVFVDFGNNVEGGYGGIL